MPPRSFDSSACRQSLSRRAVLRTTVGAVAGSPLAIAGGDSSAGADRATPDSLLAPEVTVMTRNLGLGTSLRWLRGGASVDPETVYEHYREVRDSAVTKRARAWAAEIAETRPALVGLQEAMLIRTERPGDYEGGSRPDAGTVEEDYLGALRRALARELVAHDRRTAYEPVAVVVNADEELPAESPDGLRFDVRLTDRDVVLARRDVTVRGTETANFGMAPGFTLEDGTRITLPRGYCLVRVTLGATPFTFVNTHLDASSTFVRKTQTRELLNRLTSVDDPTVLVGDFNSGPDTPDVSYGLITDRGGFQDAHATAVADPGPTCCQWANLRNDRSYLDRRVDLVLTRGPVEPLGARRVGADPADRVRSTAEGVDRVWPSDHAGVVANLRVAATAVNPADLVRALLSS